MGCLAKKKGVHARPLPDTVLVLRAFLEAFKLRLLRTFDGTTRRQALVTQHTQGLHLRPLTET